MSAGVYIDDSGTPGTKAPSRVLHLNRKTWAAVVVPAASVEHVDYALGLFLTGLNQDYGAKELHFAEIYGGRGDFETVSLADRYRLIELTVQLFVSLDLPIFTQTLSPEYASELRRRGLPAEGSVGFLKLSNHEHLALLLLLMQVRGFIQENVKHFPKPIGVFVDEGIAKAGATMHIKKWSDIFEDGAIQYVRSHETKYIQLADFAAFVIARSQWLAAQGNLKERDTAFLNLVAPLGKCLMNVPMQEFELSEIGPEAYERMIVEDRRSKGLPDHPEDTANES
jgi:hypothetical protein